jgi:hypothetical protein
MYSHFIHLGFLILFILGEDASCEAPHFAVFSNLLPFNLSSVQIFPSAPFLRYLQSVFFHEYQRGPIHLSPGNEKHVLPKCWCISTRLRGDRTQILKYTSCRFQRAPQKDHFSDEFYVEISTVFVVNFLFCRIKET